MSRALVRGTQALRDDFRGGPGLCFSLWYFAGCHTGARRNPCAVKSRENWCVVVADENCLRRQISVNKRIVGILRVVQFSKSTDCFTRKIMRER